MKTHVISGEFLFVQNFLLDYEEANSGVNLGEFANKRVPFEIQLLSEYSGGVVEGYACVAGQKFYAKGIRLDDHSYQLFVIDNKDNMFSVSYDLEESDDVNFAGYMQEISDQEYLNPAMFGMANFSTYYDDRDYYKVLGIVKNLKSSLSNEAKNKLNYATSEYSVALSYFAQFQDDVQEQNFGITSSNGMMAFYRVLNELDDMLDEYVRQRTTKEGESVDITLDVLKDNLSIVLENNNVNFDNKTFNDFASEIYQKFEVEGENSNLVPLAGAKILMDYKLLQEICYEDVTHMVAYALCANTECEEDVSDVINVFGEVWDEDNASEIINKTFREVEDENTLYVYEEAFQLLKEWYKEYHFQDKSEVLDLVQYHANEWIEEYKKQQQDSCDDCMMC